MKKKGIITDFRESKNVILWLCGSLAMNVYFYIPKTPILCYYRRLFGAVAYDFVKHPTLKCLTYKYIAYITPTNKLILLLVVFKDLKSLTFAILFCYYLYGYRLDSLTLNIFVWSFFVCFSRFGNFLFYGVLFVDDFFCRWYLLLWLLRYIC